MARSHTDHDQCPTARPKSRLVRGPSLEAGQPVGDAEDRPLTPTGSGTNRGVGVAFSGLLTTVVSCQRHKSTVASAR